MLNILEVKESEMEKAKKIILAELKTNWDKNLSGVSDITKGFTKESILKFVNDLHKTNCSRLM
jgi:hydroxylamine reductase (hybrid-cluster protein)